MTKHEKNSETRKSTEKKLLMIDGSSYLYRAYHALPPLTNSKGQPTGAIYGVVNMLRKLIQEHAYDYIAVVFDAPGKTFRNDIYPEYKAHRKKMPDDLCSQIEPLHHIIRALGLPLLVIPHVEADDVIGTLAHQATQQGIHCLISTSDKDFAQLVGDQITLVNTMSNTVLDRHGVIGKFGVPPEAIVDYLSLVGDTSDNVPGVAGVGPKTAVKWLQQYPTLEELIAHADEIKGKVGETFRATIPQLPLNRQLVTICQDVALDIGITDLMPQAEQRDQLQQLFSALEFKTWLKELNSTQAADHLLQRIDQNKAHYYTITTEIEFNMWLEKLTAASLFSLDTETTSLSYADAQLVGLSFAVAPHDAAYVPLAHDYEGAPAQLSLTYVLDRLKPILESPDHYKVGQHIKYDMNILAKYGIELRGILHDTMLESYILNSTAHKHDLDSLALNFLNYHTIHYEDVAGTGAKQVTFNKITLETAAPYAAEDADITLQLHQHIWPKLNQCAGLKHVYETIEVPLIPVLADIEQTGVLINATMLQKQSEELEKECERLTEQAYQLADCMFNLNSSQQLQSILYEKLNLPMLEKTPTGRPSTSESALQQLAQEFPLPSIILHYRSLMKLKTTYTDRLPEQINPYTGRVHTSYHQAITATGRLSSSNPNLQNIPTRTEEGRRIRQAFIAAPGYKIISADYSQIELRIVAHLADDAAMIAAFQQGLDIHTATAAEVLGIAPEAVSTLQRRHAKAINFGLMYGMSAFGLSKQLDIDRHAAEEYIQMYFARYPSIKQLIERIRETAHAQAYVETLFGRRLYLPNIQSKNFNLRRQAERAAINAPMQGSSADIIKIAMIHLQQWLKQERVDARMIMQVHDELVLEVAESELQRVTENVPKIMCQAAQLRVPLEVSLGVGDNWDEAH